MYVKSNNTARVLECEADSGVSSVYASGCIQAAPYQRTPACPSYWKRKGIHSEYRSDRRVDQKRLLAGKLIYGFLTFCTVIVGAILAFEAVVIASLSIMAWG